MPRLTCTEALFEISFPFAVRGTQHKLETATMDWLIPVAEAQAEVAFIECGVNPMERDREGFLKRVARRIEQGRVFVVTDGEKLVFKADIIAETAVGRFWTERKEPRSVAPSFLERLFLRFGAAPGAPRHMIAARFAW